MFLGPETQLERGCYHYLEYRMPIADPGFPRNFGGVSGGGVWRVSLYWFADGVIDGQILFLRSESVQALRPQQRRTWWSVAVSMVPGARIATVV